MDNTLKHLIPRSFLTNKITRVFKLTVFILFTSILQLPAENSYAQEKKITLNVKNKTIKHVLKEIENISDFTFVYNDADIAANKKVSIKVNNRTIYEILDQILIDCTYSLNDKMIVIKSKNKVITGQKTTISGKIIDESDLPLIGASVRVAESNLRTLTNVDGDFSIQAEIGNTIFVSYLGYVTKEVKITSNQFLTIRLEEDNKILNEVVVVGFGSQKKVNLTGSVGIATADDIKERPVQNVTQALQGLVPGLNIYRNNGELDAAASVNIRGVGTIGGTSSASPLILIDGIEGNLDLVNPQDIENISVLKDAAASSIYGSRAPFGVILVTTKKGEAGKTRINYNNSFRFNSALNLPKWVDSYSWATFVNDGRRNGGASPFFNDEVLGRIRDYQAGLITTTSVPDPSNPTVWASPWATGNANNDIFDITFKEAFAHEHNVSASGGSEKFQFYLSMGYLDQNGLLNVLEDKYRRYNPTGKINVKLTDWLRLNYSSRFTRTDYDYPTEMVSGFWQKLSRQGWPNHPIWDPNGNWYRNSMIQWFAAGGMTNKQTDNIVQQFSFNLEPIKNWVTTGELSYSVTNVNMKGYSPMQYYYDVNNDPYLSKTTSYVKQANSKVNYLNFNLHSTYDFIINKSHNIKAMVGFQAEEYNNRYMDINRAGIMVDGMHEINLTNGLDFYGNEIATTVTGHSGAWSTAGFFGRFNYDYKGRYLAEFNLRYDGSSRFREDSRWDFFPSFSAGWNISRESFWESLESYVDILKLRFSYGKLGNQNTDNWYPTYPAIIPGTANGSWLQNGVKPNIVSRPDLISTLLTWEKIKTWNIGVDFGLFNNRLSGSFDYYQRITSDMVGPAEDLPLILGTKVPQTNNTSLESIGFELNIGWRDRLSSGFSYGAKFILTDDKTKIKKYNNFTNSLSNYYPGMELGEIWGYETIGIAKTDEEMDNHLSHTNQNKIGSSWAAGDIMYKDQNGDNEISNGANTLDDHGDLIKIGNSTPRFRYGLELNAAWKGVDVRAFFQGVAKRDYFSNSHYFWGASASDMWNWVCYTPHLDYFRAEASNDLPQNLDSYYARPTVSSGNKNQQTQTRYLQNAAYIRLKNIQVGYTIPKKWSNRFGVSNLRVFFSGENLWTATKLSSVFDPETLDGGTQTNGVKGGNGYPLTKTISFGLSVTL